MVFYLRRTARELSHAVGRDEANGCWLSTGKEGWLSYGPYMVLPTGLYAAGFYLKKRAPLAGQTLTIDVSAAGATDCRASHRFEEEDISDQYPSLFLLDFSLDVAASDLEVRLFVTAGIQCEVRDLVIFSA